MQTKLTLDVAVVILILFKVIFGDFRIWLLKMAEERFLSPILYLLLLSEFRN